MDERQLIDPQRMLWRDDVDGICHTIDMCFEYGDHVRCGPCAIRQSRALGVEPDLDTIPNLPEVSRLTRENKRIQGELNARSTVTDEMVERAAKALEPFANAAMGIKEFDPDFPLDGAALRASFDWYDKCQGEALKRHSVRLQDINFAAETHAAITAALGGPHG